MILSGRTGIAPAQGWHGFSCQQMQFLKDNARQTTFVFHNVNRHSSSTVKTVASIDTNGKAMLEPAGPFLVRVVDSWDPNWSTFTNNVR
jgi:hypothetical protein